MAFRFVHHEGFLAGSPSMRTTAKSCPSTQIRPRNRNLFLIRGVTSRMSLTAINQEAFFIQSLCHCGKKEQHKSLCKRAGATPKDFWAACRKKVGFSRPFWTFSHGDFPFPLLRISPCFKHFGLPGVKPVAISSMQSATFTFFTRAQQNQPERHRSAAGQTCQSPLHASGHWF